MQQTNGIMDNTQSQQLEEGKLYSTTNYSMFKGIIGNRGIFDPHVARLRRSIERKNLLAQNPILVNEKFEVIDGQHRLTAARELNVPIYYMVKNQASLVEIQLLNANNRSWLTQDYLDSYVAMGKKDYLRLQDFANEYRISVSIAMQILADNFHDKRTLIHDFKEGNFEIKDYEKAENLASLISEIRRHSPDFAWAHRTCIKALAILQEKIDPKELVSQLDRYQMVITRRPSVKDYLHEFDLIINSNREGKQISL